MTSSVATLATMRPSFGEGRGTEGVNRLNLDVQAFTAGGGVHLVWRSRGVDYSCPGEGMEVPTGTEEASYWRTPSYFERAHARSGVAVRFGSYSVPRGIYPNLGDR